MFTRNGVGSMKDDLNVLVVVFCSVGFYWLWWLCSAVWGSTGSNGCGGCVLQCGVLLVLVVVFCSVGFYWFYWF